MFFVGIVLLGIVSLKRLTIDLLPSIGYPELAIYTTYEGASSQEIETFITRPLESVLSSISGVKRITSVSKEGLSVITLQFYWGTDMEFAFLKVKEKVEDGRKLLPKDCPSPLILDFNPSSRPIVVAVLSTGGSLTETRNTALHLIKPRLEEIEGISRVEVVGGGKREVVVLLNPKKLSLYSISFSDVESALRGWNQMALGGTVLKDRIRYVLKVEGEIGDLEDIKGIPVKYTDRGVITVGDIGRVQFREKIREGDVRYNGRRCVALLIFKEAGANTVSATKRLRAGFSQLEREFKGIKITVIKEDAGLIVNSINSLKKSVIYGSLLAFFVLLLFLQNLRDPLLVSVVIPISVISTFVLMFFARVNINIMSLGGLALGVGMFVDNSIVVIESIYRKRESADIFLASIDGTEEVASPITASTLTTIIIFLPVLYIYGVTGKLFRDQALTVSFSLISSLFVSITLLPSLYNLFSGKGFQREIESEKMERSKPLSIIHTIFLIPLYPFLLLFKLLRFLVRVFLLILKFLKKIFFLPLLILFKIFNFFYGFFEKIYHAFLKIFLERKYLPLILSILLIFLTVNYYKKLKRELLPEPHTPKIEVEIFTPSECGFKETERISEEIEGKIKGIENVGGVFSRIGITSKLGENPQKSSVNRISMLIGIGNMGKREEVIQKIREILKKYPFLKYSVRGEVDALSRYLRFGESSIEIRVYYRDYRSVKGVLSEVLKRLRRIKGLVDVRSNLEEGKPLLLLKFREKNLELFGIDKRTIANYIRDSLRGRIATTLKRIGESFDIVVSTELRYKRDLDKLLSKPLNFKGKRVNLSQLIYFKKERSLREIFRDSGERYFSVFANLSGVKLSDVVPKIKSTLSEISLPVGVRLVIGGEEEEREFAFKSVKEAVILAMILIYMVMAAQFENLLYPLIIMFTLPMGFSGAFLFLHLFKATLNVISGIGLLVMVGIVVNDAIVKVDYTNKLILKGMDTRGALLEASKVRLRPILMTTFTTVFGLIPMLLLRGEGSELQRPLAIVLIGGLLFSTFLTLIFIPVLYEWVAKKILGKK